MPFFCVLPGRQRLLRHLKRWFRMSQRNGNIVPVKNQSPKQRIDGTAALLDCYVGLYEHYNEFTGAI